MPRIGEMHNNHGKTPNKDIMMKKSLLILLVLFIPIGLMAQTTLTIDVSDQSNKHVDASGYTSLTSLRVIGATGVTLPAGRTTFTLDGTGSPDLVVDFAEQASRTTLTTLTLINVNQVDISSCSALVTLNCQGKGTEWGDGTAGHLGLICNTSATAGSPTLPALTKIDARNSGVKKLDLTNAGMNVNNLIAANSLMKELRVPGHTKFKIFYQHASNIGEAEGDFSIGYNSSYQDYYTGTWSNTTPINQLEILDISGCTGFAGNGKKDSRDQYPGYIYIVYNIASYNKGPLKELYMSGCTSILQLITYNTDLSVLEVHGCSKLQKLFIDHNFLTTVDLSGCSSLITFNAKRNLLTNIDFLTVPSEGRTAEDIAKLQTIQVNGGAYSTLIKDENGVDDPGGSGAKVGVLIPNVYTNKIRYINTQYLGEKLGTFLISDNLLETLDMHERMSGLTQFSCENNMLLTLDLSKINVNKLKSADWGWDMSNEKMQVGFLNVEEVKGAYNPEIVSGDNDWVALPLPNGGGFKHLLDSTVKLYPTIEDAMNDTNVIAKEAKPFMGTIEDFNDSIGYEILCPIGHVGEHLFLHSQEEIKKEHGGKIADQDLYGKVLTYRYNTGFNGGDSLVVGEKVLDPHIEIRAHIWPYILNINPATRDKDDNTTGLNYYSSTIYLDYDAIIPQGVTVHVPVGVDTAYREIGRPGQDYTMQFDMKEVGKAGQVLPKGTPVLVKSVTVDDSPEYEPGGAAGLYSFQTAWDFDIKGWEDYRSNIVKAAVAAERGCDPDEVYAVLHGVDEENVIYKPGFDPDENPEKWINTDPTIAEYLSQNMLTGTLNDTTVARKSILTLGRQQAKGPDGTASLRIGFWRFNGTLLHAHRCYITEETLHNAMDRAGMTDAKPGGIFDFGDSYTTGVRTIVTNPQDKGEQAVYDLQGRRITGTPVPGIYIVNGKKVIVKH